MTLKTEVLHGNHDIRHHAVIEPEREHRKPSKIVQSANFVVGLGIEGDRHATERKERKDYQVLIVDNETLQSLDLVPGIIKE